MATITAAAGGGPWTTGSTWVGSVAPGAADDAVLDATSGNITINTGAVCRSLNASAYTGTLTHTAAVTLTIGDATAGAGNAALTLAAAMTYTLGNTATSAITFASTSATTQTVTTAGKTCGNLTFNGAGGNWQLADTLTATAATITITAGTLDTGGQTVTATNLASTNSNTRTLTLGASAINLSGGASAWNTTTVTGLTFNADTSTITLSGAAAAMASGTLTFNTVTYSGSGTASTPASVCTFANLTRTGTAARNDILSLRANCTITGTLTLAGNSAINRIAVQSSTLSLTRTLTAATVTASNVDLSDITAAGAGSWDLSAITGNSGDMGGNTGITFTTAATQTWSGTSGGNWSANAWTSRVPLPQDDVVIDAAFTGGQTVTGDMLRLGKSIDWTSASAVTWANSSTFGSISYGSLTLTSNVTISFNGGHTFSGRSTYTITSAGRTFTSSTGFNAPGGTYTLQDAWTSIAAVSVLGGTLDTNGQTVTALNYVQAGGILTLGASTVSLTSTAAVSIVSVTGGTVNADTSTIVVANASANSRTFAGGGKTYATLTYTVAGSTGALVVTGANTFGTVNFSDVTNARTLTLPASTTTTITGTFGVVGTAGKLMTVNSSSGGTAATLSKTSGVVSTDYLSIQDSTAAGGASWYAGANSTKVSGVTGWFFTVPSNFQFLQLLGAV